MPNLERGPRIESGREGIEGKVGEEGVEGKVGERGVGGKVGERGVEGKVGERGVEGKVGRVGIEEGSSPWERLAIEEEAKLIERCGEKSKKLSERTKKEIALILRQETDQRRIDFIREWFREHKDEIRAKGYYVANVEEGYMARVTAELGGFQELQEEIDNLYALRTDLQKGEVPIESRFLALNILNGRALKLEREINIAKKTGRDTAVLEREYEELFQLRKELSESATGTGKDLEREVQKGMAPLEGRGEYIDKNLPRRVGQEKEYLLKLGYKIKRRGFPMRRKIMIVDEKGEVVGEFRKGEEVNEFLIKKILGKEWDEKNSLRTTRRRVLVEREMHAFGASPGMAEGGINKVYARVKRRLKTGFTERTLARRGETGEQLEGIERDFEGGGKNPVKFIEDILRREGPLRRLEGRWEKDKENIRNFLESRGIPVDPEGLDRSKGEMDKSGEIYEQEVRKERGFVEWLLSLLFFSIPESSGPTEQREKK